MHVKTASIHDRTEAHHLVTSTPVKPDSEFAALWQRITAALREPALYHVEGSDERFHAWYDAGGDGKPESVWTKPLQGAKQVRLPQTEADYRKVFDAVRAQGDSIPAPERLREVTLRGHYLHTVMRHFGL